MMSPTLFPDLPPPSARCAPRDEPAPRTSHAVERLRFVDGRRSLTTHVGLRTDEIAELARAARFGPIEVRFRIPTPDRRLADVLDPHAPSPALRFASLRAARRAGLAAGVVVAPLVPGVNDHEGDLRRIFLAARRSGAAFVDAEIALPGDARRAELARELRRRYPRVAARHEVWRRTSNLSPAAERARLDALIDDLNRRFGLPRRVDGPVDPPGAGSQRRFAFAG